MLDSDYRQKLDQEAELWGREAEQQAQVLPPDWRYHRHLRHNVIMHAASIDNLLSRIKPGMKTLELGCASGWLTLAMAQRGAQAVGLDISPKALDVARRYYEKIRPEVDGSAVYEQADFNTLELGAETYDVVVTKGTLHHLVHLDHLIIQIHRALKPGGFFWIQDTLGEEALPSVLIAGALTFVLPTQTSYGEKGRALRRFGLRSPSRVKASIQAEGLSPFEGAGREHDWLQLVEERFSRIERESLPAFTGYVTAQLKASDRLALPLLRALLAVDKLLVRFKLLHATGITVFAYKA